MSRPRTPGHRERLQALVQARDNEIPVALSNPSFELWIPLHFEDCSAYLHGDQARRDVEGHVPQYKERKTVPFDILAPRYEDAVIRSERLEDRHIGNGSRAERNPPGGMWRLVSELSAFRTAPYSCPTQLNHA